jgi:predicted phage baseplate assembly protein
MSLPIPKLDDRTFEALVEEARKLIPVYAPRWTDHNLSDPGITLVDLFAWLSELELYSLDVVDDRHLLKYLALLGIKPRPAAAAKVEIQLKLTADSDRCVTVPAGTPFKTALSVSSILFESEETVEVLPLELKKVLTYFNYRFTDVTEFNDHPKTYYHVFGKYPDAGDILYLGLSRREVDEGDGDEDADEDLTGKKTRLAIYPYEEDLPPLGEGLPGEEDVLAAAPPAAETAWEYWNSISWEPLAVTVSSLSVPVLAGRGFLTFDFPADISQGNPPVLPQYLKLEEGIYYWVRCRLLRAGYEIPPRLNRVLLNMVSAVEGRTAEEKWESSGFPDQVFKVREYPVVPGSENITIEGETWEEVADFDASDPGDRHYLMEPQTGDVRFGNGINGAVPATGTWVAIHYRSGGGVRGNIAANSIKEAGVTGVDAVNPFPAHGGEEAETIKETFARLKKNLRIPYTAVTAEDYQYIAKAVPGLRVARARAVITGDNEVVVVVMPYSFMEKPLSSENFKQAVCRYLEQHRLITTSVKVSDPDYVRVSVTAEIKIKEGYDPEQLRQRIREALNRFLAPLKRESSDNEWPFGRPVYKSEINEVLEGVEGVDCVIAISLSAAGGSFNMREGNIEISPLSVVYPGTHTIELISPHEKCRQE